jgi:predicted tellurium resistance membrane protein TerC
MVNLFKHLDKAISFILVFIGIKIGIERWYHIPVGIALSVILGALALGIGFSLAHHDERKHKKPHG